MKRGTQRQLLGLFLLAFGCALIGLGFHGWALGELPAQYFGYFCVVLWVLGLFGVNIWRGGPFDPRLDKTDGGPPAAA